MWVIKIGFCAFGLGIPLLFSCKKDELSNLIMLQPVQGSISAIGEKGAFWPRKSDGSPIVIRVKFIDGGSENIRSQIIKYAEEWEYYANIDFRFVQSNESAEVRIKVGGLINQRAHVTAIGADLLKWPNSVQNMYNMYYDLSDCASGSAVSSIVLHEFGHALGLLHEQLHPSIKWNKPYIYAYYKRVKNWSDKDVDANFFKLNDFSKNALNIRKSKYDPLSIMHYGYPEGFLIGDEEIRNNDGAVVLSEGDKKFIQEIYPFPIKELFRLDDCSHQACKNELGFKQRLGVKTKKTVRDADLIIISGSIPNQSLCREGRDRYLIKDSSGKTYPFTSNTAFGLKPTETGLKSPILIQKNGEVIFSNN